MTTGQESSSGTSVQSGYQILIATDGHHFLRCLKTSNTWKIENVHKEGEKTSFKLILPEPYAQQGLFLSCIRIAPGDERYTNLLEKWAMLPPGEGESTALPVTITPVKEEKSHAADKTAPVKIEKSTGSTQHREALGHDNLSGDTFSGYYWTGWDAGFA